MCLPTIEVVGYYFTEVQYYTDYNQMNVYIVRGKL